MIEAALWAGVIFESLVILVLWHKLAGAEQEVRYLNMRRETLMRENVELREQLREKE